jgi:hypothetical protein
MVRGTLKQKYCHPSSDLHFLADALRDRHRGDTTRLSTANYPVFTVTILVEKLGQLGRLSRSGFTNHDNNYGRWKRKNSGGRLCVEEDSPWFSRKTFINSSRQAKAGRYSRCSFNVRDFAKELTPVEAFRCVANFESPL